MQDGDIPTMGLYLCSWQGVTVTVRVPCDNAALTVFFGIANDESDRRWSRSLSVGDTVGVMRLGENIPRAYRCDDFGWELVKEGPSMNL